MASQIFVTGTISQTEKTPPTPQPPRYRCVAVAYLSRHQPITCLISSWGRQPQRTDVWVVAGGDVYSVYDSTWKRHNNVCGLRSIITICSQLDSAEKGKLSFSDACSVPFAGNLSGVRHYTLTKPIPHTSA